MAGSHVKGVLAAQRDLYDRAFAFIIRSPQSDRAALNDIRNFWRKICLRTVDTTAAQHDRIVAEISHLPHALAVCLMRSVETGAMRFASTGFADVTRIAQGHPSIWFPIFTANRKNIISSLSRFEKEIKWFKKALWAGDSGRLEKILAGAAKKRAQISL
jgi:prephenate dehydrogenase